MNLEMKIEKVAVDLSGSQSEQSEDVLLKSVEHIVMFEAYSRHFNKSKLKLFDKLINFNKFGELLLTTSHFFICIFTMMFAASFLLDMYMLSVLTATAMIFFILLFCLGERVFEKIDNMRKKKMERDIYSVFLMEFGIDLRLTMKEQDVNIFHFINLVSVFLQRNCGDFIEKNKVKDFKAMYLNLSMDSENYEMNARSLLMLACKNFILGVKFVENQKSLEVEREKSIAVAKDIKMQSDLREAKLNGSMSAYKEKLYEKINKI